MESLYLLIPLALLIVAGVCALFFWAATSGQLDELDQAARRLPDDD